MCYFRFMCRLILIFFYPFSFVSRTHARTCSHARTHARTHAHTHIHTRFAAGATEQLDARFFNIQTELKAVFNAMLEQHNVTWQITCERERITLVVHADMTSHWLTNSSTSCLTGPHCSAAKKPDQPKLLADGKEKSQPKRSEQKKGQSKRSEPKKGQSKRSEQKKCQSKRSEQKKGQSKRSEPKKGQSKRSEQRKKSQSKHSYPQRFQPKSSDQKKSESKQSSRKRSQPRPSHRKKSQSERSDETKKQTEQSEKKEENQSNHQDNNDKDKQASRPRDKSYRSDSKGNHSRYAHMTTPRVPTRQEVKELQKAFGALNFLKSTVFGLKHSEAKSSS